LLSFSIKAAAAATHTRGEEEEEESVVYQSSSSEFVFRRSILFSLVPPGKKGTKKNRIGEEPARTERVNARAQHSRTNEKKKKKKNNLSFLLIHNF